MRRKLRTRLWLLLIPATVLGLAIYANHIQQVQRNAYTAWWVGDMVVNHLRTNDDRWPRNWDELKDDYQDCVKRSGQPWTFDELKRRVLIDWDADPNQLLTRQANGIPQFRAIWLTDGSGSHWESHEPNQIVLDYLNQRRSN